MQQEKSQTNQMPKLRQRPTWPQQAVLPLCKDSNYEDFLVDDIPFDSNKTTSTCSKIILGAKDMSTSSKDSESGLADLPCASCPLHIIL